MSVTEQLEILNATIQPYLSPGEHVYRAFYKGAHGYNYGGFCKRIDGIEEDATHLNDEANLSQSDDLFTAMLDEVPSHSKSIFRFTQGTPASFETLTVQSLQEDIHLSLQEGLSKKQGDKLQLTVSFYKDENGRIKTKESGSISSGNTLLKYKGGFDLMQSMQILYHQTGKNLEQLFFELTKDSFTICALPVKPDLGWSEIPENAQQLDEGTQKRIDAIKQARVMRDEAYSRLGTVSPDVLSPVISPLFGGGSNWPAGRPQYRIIHTPISTLLITDGMTDPFESEKHDKNLEYNGHAAEFYFEFKGSVSADRLHYFAELLNYISQSLMPYAIKDVLNKSKTVSLNLPSGDGYLIMNVLSETIPPDMQLNLEKVFLVSCKIMSAEEAKTYDQTTDDNATKVRNNFSESYVKNKSYCYQALI